MVCLRYSWPSYILGIRVGLIKNNCRDTANPTCPTNDGIEDTEIRSYILGIRVGLIKNNCRDTANPTCPTNDGIEDTENFFVPLPFI